MIKFRNKKQIRAIGVVSAVILSGILTVFYFAMNPTGNIFNIFDYKALDIFYKLAVKRGEGPKASFTPEIVYLNITDETYNFFDKNYLDRKDMATLNNTLSHLGTEGVIYDIIFARKSTEKSDLAFSASIETLGNVYLPTALVLSEKPYRFRWKNDAAHERLSSNYLGNPYEKLTTENDRRPFYAVKALMQQNEFAIKARGSGDINAKADRDGIYRHITMLARVDDRYFPTLALSVFLDWAGVSLNDVSVEWGEKITIPASKESFLDKDVIIPIDRHGRTFIPFVQAMGKDFGYMSVHTLISNFQDEDLRGNLLERFEGNFVFVGDIAIGTSDLGYTPLQSDAPLVITHASLLNALLTNTFYSQWPLFKILVLICMFMAIMACASIARSSRFLYGTGIFIIIAVPVLTWIEFVSFRLFPVVTVSSVLMLIFFAFIATLETSGSKERAFIRNTFARYLPETVVNTLLAHPDMVTLGGEERIVTVLFSDIANFTTIAESLSPKELVTLLNEYFTEMADIIMHNGGIIDKFQGDSIMAEFGMPIPLDDHADRAVTAALQMLDRLSELRNIWKNRDSDISGTQDISGQTKNYRYGYYELHCRIGINTNNMIAGNMGSKNVLDYTVIGDAVNLASRLEGANKLYGTSLIISRFTLNSLSQGRFKTRILDYVKVKGKNKPVRIYEVYGETENNKKNGQNKQDIEQVNYNFDKNNHSDMYYVLYHQGFQAYMAQEFTKASNLFNDALTLRPGDLSSVRMLERIDKIDKSRHPDSNWDGSVSLTTK
ncbi:MAG: CHASE2 domain-containing protein [Desulfamplus sp.]|nr:CHASE2 domain-containing protein [Desulfamplus sp.]